MIQEMAGTCTYLGEGWYDLGDTSPRSYQPLLSQESWPTPDLSWLILILALIRPILSGLLYALMAQTSPFLSFQHMSQLTSDHTSPLLRPGPYQPSPGSYQPFLQSLPAHNGALSSCQPTVLVSPLLAHISPFLVHNSHLHCVLLSIFFNCT